MATRTTATPSRPYKTPCDTSLQTCPECGGLECLCRPRFFAGQLLTDEDLNRLDHYIVAKNKLHNRYLFGWGVVCGLEVVCSPCNMVSVRPGYAISPCGEDIIVCKETSVDICSLINACRKPQRDPCAPIDASQKDPCSDTTEKWILSIRYRENATRGITSLKGDSGSCGSRCSCGGSSSCGCEGSSKPGGCGCGGSGKSSSSSGGCSCKSSSTRTKTQPPAQCEPTVLCEGYAFEVCQLPPPSLRTGAQPDVGALTAALQCCITLYKKYIASPPADQTLSGIKNWCCSVREGLAELFAGHPGHTCALAEQIGALCTDPPQGTNPSTYLTQILTAVSTLLTSFLLDCLCSSLLPPCPSPVDDDRIFLATVTVRRKDCKILEICNWDQRRFVLTFPMLRYWLSPLPFAKNLKNNIAKLCCAAPASFTKGSRAFAAGFNADYAAKMNSAQLPLTAEAYSANLGAIFAQAIANQNRTVSPATVVEASLGGQDAKQQTLLSAEEMADPGDTVLIHEVIRPLLQNSVVSRFLGTSSTFGDTDAAALRDEIASLRSTLDAQQKALDALNAKLDNR